MVEVGCIAEDLGRRMVYPMMAINIEGLNQSSLLNRGIYCNHWISHLYSSQSDYNFFTQTQDNFLAVQM